MEREVLEISVKELLEVISNREPRGKLFMTWLEEDCCWVAVDNRDGEAWTEYFYLKEAAIKWLKATDIDYEDITDIKDDGDHWTIFKGGKLLWRHSKQNNFIEKIKAMYGY